ncbi:MAG: three-Cys-motif partner protein TcmP [Deltaproteobacteria bacterium]|nr:three-Cys-motif partner protein TcmP [Deltaproteobacteria bacterium]
MVSKKFFDESREQSQIKTEIVEKYFDAWASIITATQDRVGRKERLGYVDLFAGPGRYKDGSISTPLRILTKAIEKESYANRLVTIFNDKDEQNVRNLEKAIQELPNISKLKYQPGIWNEEVGDKIAAQFELISKIPILAFIDPWGYKGLSLRLVDAFLQDWGCDCIFFFNYSRINAGLSNPFVREHMDALFGDERADKLRFELEPLPSAERESIIVNELSLALKGDVRRYVLPFCFKNLSGKRTTHHLIFVTKHFRGYEVMKDIMAKASPIKHQGVPTFAYSPASSRRQSLLFELNRPLDELEDLLLSDFAGRTLYSREINKEHSVDRPYISKNYKDILKRLEQKGIIQTKGRRSKRGFADDIIVTFPEKR